MSSNEQTEQEEKLRIERIEREERDDIANLRISNKEPINSEESHLLMWLIIAALFQGEISQSLDEPEHSDRDSELADMMGFASKDEYSKWREDALKSGKTIDALVEEFDHTRVDFDAARSDSHLLALIRKYESSNNYDVSWGGKEPVINGKKLTECKINEVLDWQRNCGKKSTAVGAYQIIRKTLEGLVKREGLSGDEKFDEAMQDRLGMALANRRGYDDFLAGKITAKQLSNRLINEWAPLQGTDGKGAYENDGLNGEARASNASVLTALRHDFEANKNSMGIADEAKPDTPAPDFSSNLGIS